MNRLRTSKYLKNQIVKESITHFKEDSDPINDMGIGFFEVIKQWVKDSGWDNGETTEKDYLWIAAAEGRIDFIKYLLDKGYDVHTNNDSALIVACGAGQVEAVKVLLDAGADIHARNHDVLYTACRAGHPEVVKVLIDAGVNVFANNKHALNAATFEGHTEVVKILKDHIKKEKNKIVKESLTHFTEEGDPIKDMGIGLDAEIKRWVENETKYNYVPANLLWLCAGGNKVEFVKYLLDKGYDVHYDEDRALRWACTEGHPEVVKVLLDAGADVHAKHDFPIRAASIDGYAEITKLLIDAGADVHAHDEEALYWAISGGYTEVVKVLLDAGADANTHDGHPLRLAMEKNHTEIVKLLQDHTNKEKQIVKESINRFREDSDPIDDMDIGLNEIIKKWIETETRYMYNKKDSLWICAEAGKLEFVKYLVSKGHDIHAENDHALNSASFYGHIDVVKFILDIDKRKYKNYDEAIYKATITHNDDIAKLLYDRADKKNEIFKI